jgi:ferric-dicitrate binding protein FerR (iron transport regulator)
MVVIDRTVEQVLLERRRPKRRRRRANRHLRDPLSARQRRQLAVLIVAWAVSAAVAWAWWLEPAHDAATPQMVLNSRCGSSRGCGG